MPLPTDALGACIDGAFVRRIYWGSDVVVPGRTNLRLNPGCEGDTTGLSAYSGASLARVTTEHHTGVASVQVTTAAATGVVVYTPGVGVVVAAGPVTASAWVKAPAGSAMRLNVKEYTPASSHVVPAVDAAFTGTGEWQRVSATQPMVAAGNTVRIEIDQRTATAQVFYMDDVLIEQSSTLNAYRDGDSPGWAWTGTAHASTSYGLT